MDGSGRLCLRNRRFMKPIHQFIPSPYHVQPPSPQNPPAEVDDNHMQQPEDDSPSNTYSDNHPGVSTPLNRSSRLLKKIGDFNKPGHSEGSAPEARLRGGKEY